MTYQITYAYSGHSEILVESNDLSSITEDFNSLIKHWELHPHDQYELESVDGEYDYQTILEHTFNEGNWECED